MKKGIITLKVISIMLLIGLTRVNASTNVTSIWESDMWKANGDKMTYQTFGFQQGFDTSQGGNGERSVVQTFFNSNISVTGGGLPVPDSYDYMSFRIAIWNPLNAAIDGNMAMSLSFQTQNDWGSGSNCEIISDSSVQFYNNQRLAKLYTVKCPIINGTTSISTFNVSYIATSGALFVLELSGDILFYKSGTMTDQQIINSINTQTQTITDNQNQNTQQILEQNATYENTPSKDMTNETQEMDNFEQAEQGLINSLDLNMSVMDGITINPNASAYIWQIVDRLRQINPAIILLMTSILGMGIIKMVLNR